MTALERLIQHVTMCPGVRQNLVMQSLRTTGSHQSAVEAITTAVRQGLVRHEGEGGNVRLYLASHET